MNARFRQLEALFDAALSIPVAQRAAWAAAECGGDAQLERELLALLANDERLAHARTANPLHIGERALDAALDAQTAAGGRLGPYHLREEIGRGGMGRVIRAVRYEDGVEREVAIKFVRREMLDETTRRRFRQELRALASLDHPGIARLLEGGTAEDGTPYVVMELVRGEPLLAYCAKRSLGVGARLRLFRQILAAVAHAHRNLIVHRDIKPGNVLVDAHDQARLLDFGLAKPVHADPAETSTVERYFTPAYAAPEQLRGDATGVACDVYSLGALLYELLAGIPPFRLEGRTAAEVERLLLSVPPAPIDRTIPDEERGHRSAVLGVDAGDAWRRQLRGDLDAIVQKALRKEPSHRYLSAEQFDEDIARCIGGHPVSAARSTALYRARKYLVRNAIPVAVVATILAALVGGLVAVAHGARIAAEQRDRAQAALSIMRDSFKAADPMHASGPQVGARDILAAAAERVRDLVGKQPQLYVELAAEITEVQLALGIYERNDALVAAAIENGTARQASAELHRKIRALDARRLLGLQELAAADAALTELEAERNDDPAVLTSRAYYWLVKNQPDAGIPLAERAARLSEEAGDVDGHAAATMHLAELLNRASRQDDALATFDALLARQVAELGSDHPRALATRLRRVPVLSALGRHDEATQEAAAVTNALPERFGPESAMVARANSVLAQARIAAGDDAGSIAPAEAAARGYYRSLGPFHTTALKARFNLAHLLARTGAPPSRVDPEFDGVIADATRRDPRDPLMWFFRAHHAKMLLRRQERERALAVLLPDGLDPDLAALDPANRADYLGFLRDALGPTACADELVPDERRSRGTALVCAPDPG